MLDAVQSNPRFNQVLCASVHYSAFSVKSCLMLSKPPPLQSGLVRLAITVSSLSSHAWCCPSHPHFNQVLCVWPLQCLLCQVMLDAVQATPTSIRSWASGHYSAFSVKSCLMMSNPPPLQSGIVHLAITVPSLSSHAWWFPIHPHFNQVLCIWPLQCLLSHVMLDDVQSTPASIRSCASGHYSAFSVKSYLMMSNPPPLQSGIVHLAITVPSLSSHAWWCQIHPRFNHVLCIWPLQCLLCQVMLDDVQSTPASIRYCTSDHYSAFSVKSCLMMSNPPPLQSGLVLRAITLSSLSSHAWCCPMHPRFNQVLCASGHYSAFSVKSCLMMSNPPPDSIRSCASGHYSAFSVKSCLMLCNPPPLQSGLVRLVIIVASLSSHAWCCPIHPRFNQILCVWPS